MQTSRDNYSLGCAGLGAGTTGATLKTTNVLPFQIGGRSYSKAVTDNIPFVLQTQTPAASITALAASQVGVFFITIDVAGAVTYRQSGSKAGVTAAGYQAGGFEWPLEESGFAIIGAIKVATNASGAFTAGTTLLGAANQTVTYYNAGDDLGVSIPY